MIDLGGGHLFDPILAVWDIAVLMAVLFPPALLYKRITR